MSGIFYAMNDVDSARVRESAFSRRVPGEGGVGFISAKSEGLEVRSLRPRRRWTRREPDRDRLPFLEVTHARSPPGPLE